MYRRGACYPVLVPETTARVVGTVVAALTSRDVALLRLYEGPDYDIHEISVRLSGWRSHRVRPNAFLPGPGCEATSEIWTLEDWQKRFRQTFVRRVRRHRRANRSR